jgi:hypothetical protein
MVYHDSKICMYYQIVFTSEGSYVLFFSTKKKREIDLIFYISESLTLKEENWREYVRPTEGEPPWTSLGKIHCCSPAREKLRPTADSPPFNSRRGCSATAALWIAGGRWQASLLVACRSAAIAIDRFDRQRVFSFDEREISISDELW